MHATCMHYALRREWAQELLPLPTFFENVCLHDTDTDTNTDTDTDTDSDTHTQTHTQTHRHTRTHTQTHTPTTPKPQTSQTTHHKQAIRTPF
jgi:hypothetical protein